MTNYETDIDELEKALYERLEERYGSLLCGDQLRKALGYPSSGAFSRAVYRRTVPIPVFRVKNRRGSCALTLDVARWLARAKGTASQSRKEAKNDLAE